MALRIPITLMLCLASHATFAARVTIRYMDIDEGFSTALLEASSQRHVDAMRRLILTRYKGSYEARRWEHIEEHMQRANLARLEYEYATADGVAIRTYHAIGGEPLGQVAARAFEGPLPESPPGSPAGSDAWESEDERASLVNRASHEAMVATEASDDAFYAGFDALDRRAPLMPAGKSIMPPYWREGRFHGFDAEHKALRAIEEGLLDGTLPRGGRIRGLLSSGICTVCQSRLQRFADAYAVDIELGALSPDVPVRTREALLASGRARIKTGRLIDTASERPLVAFDLLGAGRRAQVRENLTPKARERGASGRPWQRRSFRFSLAPTSGDLPAASGTGKYVETPEEGAQNPLPGC